MHDAFVMDQHAIGHWIIVANDGIHQFMHKSIGIKTKLLYRKPYNRRKEGCAPRFRVLVEPCFKPLCNALGLRHSAQARRMLHHPLAFGDRELTKQEKSLARCGCDPVGIAAACIEKGRLRCP